MSFNVKCVAVTTKLIFLLSTFFPPLAAECHTSHFKAINFNTVPIETATSVKYGVTTSLRCATMCTRLYSDSCNAYFYNYNSKSCFLYNSSFACLSLRHEDNTKGFAVVNNAGDNVRIVECFVWPTSAGIHTINTTTMSDTTSALPVTEGYFDEDLWLVIQRRNNGSEDFYRSWTEYETGFGNITNEFWLGNQYLYALTNQKRYELQIDLELGTGQNGTIRYNHFRISGPEDKYRLSVGGPYEANIKDDFTASHNGQRFSAANSDNDDYGGSCARLYRSGWWYRGCGVAHLNGRQPCGNSDYCSMWNSFGANPSRTQMKIRPAGQ